MKPHAHQFLAKNFAAASENKMHSDETAGQYGFRGGLVPGVGVYAYMTIPVVEAWGRDWLERGAMWGKFFKPVYDGEIVTVRARHLDSETIETEVANAEGTLCAAGKATRKRLGAIIDPSTYPSPAAPARENRRAPEVTLFAPGSGLGAIEFEALNADLRGESGNLFVDDVCDPLALYRGADAPLHPAVYPARANSILMANVALGPWIHTESAVEHFGIPRRGERVSVRGRVLDVFEKRGHAFIVVDAGFFGDGNHPIARVIHTAIMKPALAAHGAS